ncbi:MAG: hypothetical protein PUP92_38255, partial [Rhizonema sp. PD38]|nr:hypothetical protein [Rhizonema sp. PD38]
LLKMFVNKNSVPRNLLALLVVDRFLAQNPCKRKQGWDQPCLRLGSTTILEKSYPRSILYKA